MEDLQLALTTARVDQRNFGLWINNWQVGQTLNALVTSQLPSGELVLRVAGQQITATSDIPIQQGANLMLEVKQLQPVPTLRVLNPATAAAASVGGTLQLIPGTGTSLASPSLAAVAQGLQASQLMQALPASIAEPLSQLLRLVSRADRLSQPEGLAAALRGSGIFLESSLQAVSRGAPQTGTPGADFKGGLFSALARVDAALSQLDPAALRGGDATALLELKRELEGGLGRIVLHQLNSQPVEGQTTRSWQLEIPVAHAGAYHSLRVELEQERGGGQRGESGGDDDSWRVTLNVTPPALGDIQLQLRLRGEDLDLRMAAAQPAVRELMDAGLPALQRALESRGIRLRTTATAGLVDAPRADDGPASPGSAVDMHA